MMRTAALLATLVLVPALTAQETSGRMHGRILTSSGVTDPRATITLSSPALPAPHVARSNAQGYFVAWALPPGEYRAHVRSFGHREAIVEGIQVALGTSTALGDITLTRTEVRLEPIVIAHDAMRSDPLSTELASRIDVRLAERLPLGRDYQGIQFQPPMALRLGVEIGVSRERGQR